MVYKLKIGVLTVELLRKAKTFGIYSVYIVKRIAKTVEKIKLLCERNGIKAVCEVVDTYVVSYIFKVIDISVIDEVAYI